MEEKWMWVSSDNTSWFRRKVFAKKLGLYLAWLNAHNDETADQTILIKSWKYAKEIIGNELMNNCLCDHTEYCSCNELTVDRPCTAVEAKINEQLGLYD